MEEELKRIRSEFVPRVSNTLIRELLDDLQQQKVFSAEEKDFVMENHKCRADQARYLISEVIKKGERASQILIDSMKERDTYLCSTLGLISSPGFGDDKPKKVVVKPKKQTRGNGGRKRRRSESKESCTVDGPSDSNKKIRSTGQALTEKELMKVAETLGKEWEQAAIHLDLETIDLDDIKAEHRSVIMQKLKMLELWTRRRPPGKATAQDLLDGLKDMDLPLKTYQLLTDMKKS